MHLTPKKCTPKRTLTEVSSVFSITHAKYTALKHVFQQQRENTDIGCKCHFGQLCSCSLPLTRQEHVPFKANSTHDHCVKVSPCYQTLPLVSFSCSFIVYDDPAPAIGLIPAAARWPAVRYSSGEYGPTQVRLCTFILFCSNI